VDDLYRQRIDVEIEAEFQRRQYAGTQSWDMKRFRVVGVRDEDADEYHLYITNLPREEFSPEIFRHSIDADGRQSCCFVS